MPKMNKLGTKTKNKVILKIANFMLALMEQYNE